MTISTLTLLGLPNYVDSGTVTATSEAATLPATNVQNIQASRKWRSDDTDEADTILNMDFGQPRAISGVAIIGHNLDSAGKIRIRLGNDPTFSVVLYDSGDVDALPTMEAFGVLPWGIFRWGGKPANEDLVGRYVNTPLLLEQLVIARYMRIELKNETNAAGYLQVGRVVAGPAVTPSLNMQYGAAIGYMDNSRHSTSRGGQTWSDEQQRYRVLSFKLADLPADEIYTAFFDRLDRAKGTFGDVFVLMNPADTTNIIHTSFYGRVSSLQPVRKTYFQGHEKDYEITELL